MRAQPGQAARAQNRPGTCEPTIKMSTIKILINISDDDDDDDDERVETGKAASAVVRPNRLWSKQVMVQTGYGPNRLWSKQVMFSPSPDGFPVLLNFRVFRRMASGQTSPKILTIGLGIWGISGGFPHVSCRFWSEFGVFWGVFLTCLAVFGRDLGYFRGVSSRVLPF
jgi:hypothetical protein